MAFVPAFSILQTTDATSFIVQDDSTGTDILIVQRRIFLQLSDGSYLVPAGTPTNYIDFPLSDGTSKTILGILPIDQAISITLQWLDVANNILYSATQTFALTENEEDFDYGKTQDVAADRSLLEDTNYVFNRFRFRMTIEAAVKAVEIGNDIGSSQQMMDLNLEMMNNETYYF